MSRSAKREDAIVLIRSENCAGCGAPLGPLSTSETCDSACTAKVAVVRAAQVRKENARRKRGIPSGFDQFFLDNGEGKK